MADAKPIAISVTMSCGGAATTSATARSSNHCFVTLDVVISGFCEIGEYLFLDVDACLGGGLKVGHAVVGAGAVVVKDLPRHGVCVGNRASPTRRDSVESFGVEEDGSQR